VGDFDPLPGPGKIDGMLADNVAGPDRLDADLLVGALADNAVAGIDPGLFQFPPRAWA
jgi:hypothetical protein